jgi:hypothetical protein
MPNDQGTWRPRSLDFIVLQVMDRVMLKRGEGGLGRRRGKACTFMFFGLQLK